MMPGPGDQHAVLARGHAVIVGADKFCPLRNENITPGGGIVDIFPDLADDLPRQVAADAADHDGGNDGPCLDLIR